MHRRPGAQALTWAAFGAMTFIWGSTFLAIRVSNQEGYDPWSAVAVRVVLAGAMLVALTRALGLRWPHGRELAASAAAGVLIYALNFGLLYYGELTVPSATAAVLWGVFPALTALGASVMLQGREPLTAAGMGGALVAALGLAVVFWSHLSLDAPLVGFAAILLGIAAAAVGSLVTKRWAHGVHPVAFNAVAVSVGALILVPLAFAAGEGLALPPNAASAGALLYLTLAGSMVAFNLWAWLLKRWSATRLSFQTVLSPLLAVVLGWALLAEPVDALFLAGTALVLAGTWLAVRSPEVPDPAAAEEPGEPA